MQQRKKIMDGQVWGVEVPAGVGLSKICPPRHKMRGSVGQFLRAILQNAMQSVVGPLFGHNVLTCRLVTTLAVIEMTTRYACKESATFDFELGTSELFCLAGGR